MGRAAFRAYSDSAVYYSGHRSQLITHTETTAPRGDRLKLCLAEEVLLVDFGPGVRDPHLAVWTVEGVGLDVVDLLGDLVTAEDLAEDDVLAVQPCRTDDGNEELGGVAVWS